MQHLLRELKPTVVALSEAEVPVQDTTITFKGYGIHYPSPSKMGKYRLLLLLRQDAAALYRAQVVKTTPMEIWMVLHLPDGPTMICSVYRQWTETEGEDLEAFHSNLREYSTRFDRILVIGDVNLDWARRTDPKYYRRKLLQEHCACLEELQLHVANELDPVPTYKSYALFRGSGGDKMAKESILDHLYYAGLAPPRFQVLPYAATDHRPILASFMVKENKGALRQITCRNFRSLDASICWAINAERLAAVFQHDDVDTVHRIIVKEITDAMDLVAPKKTILVKERKAPLYLSPATLQAIHDRDTAASGSNHTLFKKLRNKANRLVRKDRLASNVDLLKRRRNDPKTIWSIANMATGRAVKGNLPPRLQDGDNVVEGESSLATFTNTFYLDKISRIRNKIDSSTAHNKPPPTSTPTPAPTSASRKFKFCPPSEAQVHRIIMGLNNTQALGVDGIPVVVLKMLAPVIAAPLAHLLRRSFESATVPDEFKLAKVTPVHKGKDKPMDQVSSFRPISILPAMSKVLERAALLQLSPHLAPLLPPSQFGFRQKRSTTMAILTAQGSWAEARARGLAVGVAGYDMSAAFDTVDPKMLAAKLSGMGIVDKEGKWFRHYLLNRRQQVDYNGALSPFQQVPYGVPQGSILGPVLFLVLVSDLPRAVIDNGGGSSSSRGSTGGSNGSNNDGSLEVGISGYADDVAVWVAGKDPHLIRRRLEQISSLLVDYCAQNYLAINGSKTQILWAGCPPLSVRVGDDVVEPASAFEFLGISFDRQLAVTPHLNDLVGAARSMVIMCRRLLQHLPPQLVRTVMGSMIRGKLGYACAVLPPRLSDQSPVNVLMNKIQVALNDIGRAIVGCKRSEKRRIEEILSESKIPSLNRVVVETIGIECWKALHVRDAPDLPLAPLGNLLCANRGMEDAGTARKTRANTNNSLPPPTKVQMNTFTWWAYLLWNSSPPPCATRPR